jgi:hypothetical protein
MIYAWLRQLLQLVDMLNDVDHDMCYELNIDYYTHIIQRKLSERSKDYSTRC